MATSTRGQDQQSNRGQGGQGGQGQHSGSQGQPSQNKGGQGAQGSFGEHAGKVMDEVKEAGAALASQAKDQASAAMGAVTERASEFGRNVVERADEAASAAGRRIEDLAEGLRQNTPNEGMLGACSNRIAETLETSGKYLEEQGVSGMVDDMTEVIRRNPIPAVLVGIGIGFVLARATSRS